MGRVWRKYKILSHVGTRQKKSLQIEKSRAENFPNVINNRSLLENRRVEPDFDEKKLPRSKLKEQNIF